MPGKEHDPKFVKAEICMTYQAVEFVQVHRVILLIIISIGGQPARATEILSVRHSNTAEGGHRNIFIEDEKVVFVTRYHKGYHLSGDVKIIHRYLPQEVGELYVKYLWLVLPFQRQMEALAFGNETIEPYLWPKDGEEKKWTSERMRQVLFRSTMASLGHEITVQAYREIAIGISRRFMRGSTSFQHEDDEGREFETVDDVSAEVQDLQAGHTSHVAGMIYARGIMEQSGVVASMRQHFRKSSENWHGFLGFRSANVDINDGSNQGISYKHMRFPFEEEANEEQFERRQRLKRMNAAEQLRQMMGDGAKFRGVQQPAMEAIQAGASPVVAVMATGEGKSILFMLPAWVESGGTTVVVVPLVALRGDMKRRCDKFGIECVEWERMRQPDGAAIVLVTPESAVGEEFGTFLNRMRTMKRLDRIVIDECHVILNDKLDFRKYLQQLGRLMMAKTQMILLTATLPPTKEVELQSRMGWAEGEMKIFRAPTVRKNVRYGVMNGGRYSKQRERELVDQLVGSVLRESNDGKVVIYCNTIPKVEALATAGLFCCEAFHSKVKSGRKMEILEDFRTGRVRVVVATSALGMGVDIPDIRLIVHVDEPRNLLDYAQESGRAGRDGLMSQAIIIGWRETSEEMEELMKRLMGKDGTRECRRVVMSEYLDGRFGRRGCEEGEEKCDVCMEKESEIERQQRQQRQQDEVQLRQQRQQDQLEFRRQDKERGGGSDRILEQRQDVWMSRELILQELWKWKGVCVVCVAEGKDYKHSISHCKEEKGVLADSERQKAQRTIKFQPYSGCFKCGVPQDICNRFEGNENGGFRIIEGKSCQFFGVVFGILFGVKHGYRMVWDDWMTRLSEANVDVSDEMKFLKDRKST